MVELWIFSIMIVSTLLGAFGSLFLKLGSKKVGNVKNLIFNKTLVFGLVLFVGATVLIIIALKFGELSKIFPLTSLTYVWVAIISSKFLKESMNAAKIIAFAFIVIGVVLVTV